MLKQLSLFALIANPLVFHVESLAFQRRCHTRRMTSLKQQSPSHQDYYDAEEAAAWDAHDLSDPGMEAAMMEAAVMIAHDVVAKTETQPQEIIEPKITPEEHISEAYDEYVTETMKFQKTPVNLNSRKKVDEDHSTVRRFQKRIADADE